MLMFMLTFLFWNLARRDIADTVAALARENDVDVLILAENAIRATTLLRRLNPPGSVRYHYAPSPSGLPSKVQTFFGYSPEFIRPLTEYSPRAAIWRINLPSREEFLLCTLHLPSKLHMRESDLAQESALLNRFIRDEERAAGHSKTVVVGDFNMNPFEPGLTLANGFNAVMARDVALQRSRRISGRAHPFFFNPMWNHFGDGTGHPCGTYFHVPSGYASLYWHIFDQVLVRPELISRFDVSNLRILDSYSGGRLTRENGRPFVSDHLPIVFQIDL